MLGLAGTVLVAVALSLVALTGVLDGTGWVAPALLAALAVVAAAGTARALRLPAATVPLFGAGALVLALSLLLLREPALLGFVPTAGSVTLVRELWGDAAAVVAEQPAPYPATAGLVLLAALGAGVVALFVDTVLVALRLPAAAALGVLAVLAVPALVLPGSVGPVGTAAGVLAALVLLAGGRHWGAVREPRTAAAPGSWPRALVVGAGVLAVTVLVPGLVPGFVSGAFPQGSGLVGERAAGVGPLRGVGQDQRSAEQSPRLEYTTGAGGAQLLRVVTLADFDDDEWFPDATGLEDDLGELGPGPLQPAPEGPERTTAVRLLAWPERWVPLPWAPVGVTAPAGADWSWDPDSLTVRGDRVPEEGTEYEVRSVAPEPTSARLREAPEAPGTGELEPYLDLPEDTPAALREAARERAGDAPTAFDRALALQEWLRSEEFRYDVDVPAAQGYDAGGMGALEEFLATRTGYSGHFAPAMAVMARELGIPSRVAVGYLPPQETGGGDPFGDTPDDDAVRVLPRDAHAWPELWFEGTGWVRFEPTPGTADVPGYATGGDEPGEDGDGQNTAEPDPTDEPTPASTPENPETDAPSAAPTTVPTQEPSVPPAPEQESAPSAWLPWLGALLAAALLALAAAGPRLVRHRRRARRMRLLEDPLAPADERALAAWSEVEDLAVDHGLGRAPAETPRTFLDRLVTAVPTAEEPLRRIGKDVERALYAPAGGTWEPGTTAGDVETVRSRLEAQGGPAAGRARWFPPSVTRRR
ncbi:transglutaminase TgpA family protein [Kocuria rhizosphaerae]|uniref:transglutaminase TgpA family protein n=1 Tax=Kocuria rhizosphaerae TaxID=3376285 RepID=UPI0037BEECCD